MLRLKNVLESSAWCAWKWHFRLNCRSGSWLGRRFRRWGRTTSRRTSRAEHVRHKIGHTFHIESINRTNKP